MSGEIKKELYVNDTLLKGRLHIAYPMISFMQHPKGQLFLYNFFLNLECSKKEEDLNVCYVSQLDHSDISWIHYLNNHRCYLNLKERRIISFSREIEDMALVNYEEMRKGHYLMLKYFCTYDSRIMPRILEILKRHEERSIHTYLKLEKPCLKKENCTQVFFLKLLIKQINMIIGMV